MTITLQQARPLCTKSELELVQWSTPKRVKELDASRLRQKLSRARKLRDKFRDLGDSQKRQIRGKESRAAKGGPAQDNRNTRMKEQLFAETIERFEAALSKREADASKASAAGTKKSTKKTTQKTGKKVSTKSGMQTDVGAAERVVTKKSGKKASKKVTKKTAAESASDGKKTGKKVSKKAGSPASALLSKKGRPQPTALTPDKKRAIKKVLASSEMQQNNLTLTTVSADIRPKTKAMAIDKGGAKRLQGHISARGRRTQAKRDAK